MNNETLNITFEFYETVEGRSEWWIELNDEPAGDLTRERGERWASGTRRGWAVDHDSPMQYCVSLDHAALKGLSVKIPDGTNLRVAKKMISAAIANHLRN